MAVFTSITYSQLIVWLKQFDLGELISFRDTDSGIENSNYFVTTYQNQQYKKYVLTLFERLSENDLPFYLYLMQHLANQNLPVPAPVPDINGNILGKFNGKPTVVVNELPGASITSPDNGHCKQMGAMQAQLHLAAQSYSRKKENLRGLSWWEKTIPLILPYLSTTQKTLISNELAFHQHFFASNHYAELPAGPIHCDLFRDNVFFDKINGQDQLSGIFDFYFAAYDKWLFDLAVTVNDWCIDKDNYILHPTLTYTLLKAYHKIRPLTSLEKNCWPLMLRAAALRFWTSRLWDFYIPRQAKTLKPHDPQHFEYILWHHTQTKDFPWID